MRRNVRRKKEQRGVFRSRSGVGIAECVLLTVILAIAIAAILSTMGWAGRSYAFAKEELDRRTAVFNWVQAFESFYPGVVGDPVAACKSATEYLGGTWNRSKNEASVRGTLIRLLAAPSAADGVLTLNLRVHRIGGSTAEFRFSRHFNSFSNETVSDDFM